MTMKQTPKSSARRLLPWLISYRDFQRYTYRALRACHRGRVVFFYYRFRGEKGRQLFALSRHPAEESEYTDAGRSFAEGQFVMQDLKVLPSLRRRLREE